MAKKTVSQSTPSSRQPKPRVQRRQAVRNPAAESNRYGSFENLVGGQQIPAAQRHLMAVQINRQIGNRAAGRRIEALIQRQSAEALEEVPAPVGDVSGAGEPGHDFAFTNGGTVSLQGRTDADFDGGSFRTTGTRTARGSGCENCAEGDCLHVTGTLVSIFRVATTVTLPSVDEFEGLTACQRERVQAGITNVLAPHEEEHVQAFRTYNGTVETPFDLNLCRAEFDSQIQAMHDGIAEARQNDSQALSDALDPFNFTVDLNCEDEEAG